MQRLDEALMIAEFALSGMPSLPADNPGIGATWGRTRHLRHTSCRSRARRGRTIPRHRAADRADAASEPTRAKFIAHQNRIDATLGCSRSNVLTMAVKQCQTTCPWSALWKLSSTDEFTHSALIKFHRPPDLLE